MTTPLEELQQYYSNLLIKQYHNKPKAKAAIESFVKELYSSGLVEQVRDAYNLDAAIGKQLDVLGKYIGVTRDYAGIVIPDSGYFGFADYNENLSPVATGFTDYANYDTDAGKVLGYGDIEEVYQLPDNEYRTILKFKIIQNHSDHSHKSINESLFNFFGTDIIATSAGDMKMYYFIKPAVSSIANIAAKKKVLPRPVTVGIHYLINAPKKLFAFSDMDSTLNSSLITGFADMDSATPPDGRFLTYEDLTPVN